MIFSKGIIYENILNSLFGSDPTKCFATEKIDIKHAGKEVATCKQEELVAMNTPLQRYLNGDDDVMTANQRRGFFIFIGSGKCINCHKGGDLGDNTSFASVSAAQ